MVVRGALHTYMGYMGVRIRKDHFCLIGLWYIIKMILGCCSARDRAVVCD